MLVEPALGEIDDLDTVAVTLVHENGCLTTIDSSRRAVYGYDQRVEVFGSAGVAASENPVVHAAFVRDATGVHGAPLPYPFLDRYAASYVAEWAEFVAAVRERRDPSVGVEDARAARHRACRPALGARAPAGPDRRGGVEPVSLIGTVHRPPARVTSQ